ncbi:glycosyltransferase [Providencia manganoxydans]|uniref:glycosyltransferase n=1 Tax=Providencia manganoxydans TaxID=2923283 RepID=UPI0034E5E2FA
MQVAASFINELYNLFLTYDSIPYHIVISSNVNNNIYPSIDKNKFLSFHIVNIYGKKKSKDLNLDVFDNYDIIFSIFGPFYLKTNAKIKITGFAQAWIIYPKNLAYNYISYMEKIKFKLKFIIQKMYFKKDDHLIVELEHVKKALVKCKIKKENEISVVYNTVSDVFYNLKMWQPIPFSSKKFTLGFLGKAYPHKNIKILKEVNEILIKKFKIDCDFLFTLKKSEMRELGFHELDNFHSVGQINVNQCPAFYQAIDALIFPSLLECFSVTPLESMKMNKLVIASNLPFVRDICKESALYFNPIDPNDIANTIAYAINNGNDINEKIKLASDIIKSLPSAQERAISYLNIINKFKAIL